MSPEARMLFTERRFWPRFWRRWWRWAALALIFAGWAGSLWLDRYLTHLSVAPVHPAQPAVCINIIPDSEHRVLYSARNP